MKTLSAQQKMFMVSVIAACCLVLGITAVSLLIPGRLAHHKGFRNAAVQSAQATTTQKESPQAAAFGQKLVYDKNKKYVALTFDDGPSKYTSQVLKVLRENNARATFFVVGVQVAGVKKVIKAAQLQGCQIASHTYRHRYFPNKSRALFVKDVRKTRRILRQQTGIDSAYVRLPYGATNKKMNKALKKMNIRKVFWTIDTRDWSRPGVDKIVHLATKNVRNGSIILMHDGGGNREQTLKALPQVIRILKDKGYEFCTVDDLYRFGIK